MYSEEPFSLYHCSYENDHGKQAWQIGKKLLESNLQNLANSSPTLIQQPCSSSTSLPLPGDSFVHEPGRGQTKCSCENSNADCERATIPRCITGLEQLRSVNCTNVCACRHPALSISISLVLRQGYTYNAIASERSSESRQIMDIHARLSGCAIFPNVAVQTIPKYRTLRLFRSANMRFRM
jgi:hypothetical protein